MKDNYYKKFIDFFKHGLYNEEIFKYIKIHTTPFDCYDEEMMNIRGIYLSYDKNILTNFKLYLPYINSEIAAFINIHPYIHAIYAYQKLGKIYMQISNVKWYHYILKDYIHKKIQKKK